MKIKQIAVGAIFPDGLETVWIVEEYSDFYFRTKEDADAFLQSVLRDNKPPDNEPEAES